MAMKTNCLKQTVSHTLACIIELSNVTDLPTEWPLLARSNVTDLSTEWPLMVRSYVTNLPTDVVRSNVSDLPKCQWRLHWVAIHGEVKCQTSPPPVEKSNVTDLPTVRYIDKIWHMSITFSALISVKVWQRSCKYFLHLPIPSNAKFGTRLPTYLYAVGGAPSPKF